MPSERPAANSPFRDVSTMVIGFGESEVTVGCLIEVGGEWHEVKSGCSQDSAPKAVYECLDFRCTPALDLVPFRSGANPISPRSVLLHASPGKRFEFPFLVSSPVTWSPSSRTETPSPPPPPPVTPSRSRLEATARAAGRPRIFRTSPPPPKRPCASRCVGKADLAGNPGRFGLRADAVARDGLARRDR